MRYLTECGTFLRECRRRFHDTGALLPSSTFLARALVWELCRPRGPCRILEVGPGTGSVTKHLLRHLQAGDALDLVEVNARFISFLERRFDVEPSFRIHRHQVELIHAPIEALAGEGRYDFIVSGVPHNNFSDSQVRTIIRAYNRLLKPDGILTYFEYALIRHLKTPFVGRRERRRLYRVGRAMGGYIRDYQVRRQLIPINVPPAIVRHLRSKPVLPLRLSSRGPLATVR